MFSRRVLLRAAAALAIPAIGTRGRGGRMADPVSAGPAWKPAGVVVVYSSGGCELCRIPVVYHRDRGRMAGADPCAFQTGHPDRFTWTLPSGVRIEGSAGIGAGYDMQFEGPVFLWGRVTMSEGSLTLHGRPLDPTTFGHPKG